MKSINMNKKNNRDSVYKITYATSKIRFNRFNRNMNNMYWSIIHPLLRSLCAKYVEFRHP